MNMFYGVLDLPWWGDIIAVLVLTHITIVSVTLYLHRCQSHRSLELHPILSHFFRLWLWLTTGQQTKAWAAIHRKHHAKCETEEDPHSPVVLGLPLVLWQGAELYRKEAVNSETLTRYGQGTPDDWIERHVYTPYTSLGVKLMFIADCILFGVPGITIWAVQMAWIPFFAAGVVNGIGHYFGYRNFECPDAATNILPFGILVGGEELHNNHHTYPTSAKLSVKWWEFDLGWLYIQIFSALGLAKAKRIAPQAHFLPQKNEIDADTMNAIIANRFQVVTKYSKSVILPTYEQVKQKVARAEQALLRKVRQSLMRADELVDDSKRQDLQQVLAKNRLLEVVYHFRMQLQGIWAKTTANQELLDALRDWCSRAEATGIQKLQEFARYLRGYTLKANGI